MNEQPGDYRIILRPEKNATPAIVRLRHALKVFLRVYGLRCIGALELTDRTEDAPAIAGNNGAAKEIEV